MLFVLQPNTACLENASQEQHVKMWTVRVDFNAKMESAIKLIVVEVLPVIVVPSVTMDFAILEPHWLGTNVSQTGIVRDQKLVSDRFVEFYSVQTMRVVSETDVLTDCATTMSILDLSYHYFKKYFI